MRLKDIQLVWWWPEWKGLKLYSWDDPARGFSSRMFWYSVIIGWVEIRIWRKGMRP